MSATDRESVSENVYARKRERGENGKRKRLGIFIGFRRAEGEKEGFDYEALCLLKLSAGILFLIHLDYYFSLNYLYILFPFNFSAVNHLILFS